METCAFLKELFGMDGQVAVIIGGTGALGLALARGLSKNGAKVVVASSRQASCDAAVETLRGEGRRCAGRRRASAARGELPPT